MPQLLSRVLRRSCKRRLVPCYIVLWWWLLYCITILEWRKLLNVEVFGVEVCASHGSHRPLHAPAAAS